MDAVGRGLVAGVAGTAAMTAAMAAAKAAGLMAGEPPPRTIAGNLEEAVGVRDVLPRPAFEASWLGQHFAYGAAAGVAYTLLIEERMPAVGPLPAGLLFGLGLWAFGYGGWAPGLGLYPRPVDQPRRRVATEVATHLVYGAATAWTARRLRSASLPHPTGPRTR
jgi:uncharacterized membrane protein YagU involved in acid resistance